MKQILCTLGLFAITWQGLYIGAEQTNIWRNIFKTNFSTTTMMVIGLGKVSVRFAYIQPIVKGVGPTFQVGGSVRLF